MFNVFGYLLSIVEVELVFVEYEVVVEVVVVGYFYFVKGECFYCFVILCDGYIFSFKFIEEFKK